MPITEDLLIRLESNDFGIFSRAFDEYKQITAPLISDFHGTHIADFYEHHLRNYEIKKINLASHSTQSNS